MTMMRFRLRPLLAIVAIVGALALALADADARVGGGSSSGSRGSRTFSAPPSTNTAPSARPIERSVTQPSATNRPTTPATAPSGGLFGRPGFLGGLAAGFLGAGLLGMLFGHGLFGGLGGLSSIFGLLVQLALIGGVAWLIVRWWSRRSQPAAAYAGPVPRQTYDEPQQRTILGGFGGSSSAPPVEITPADYDMFERMLGEIQGAYSREDLNALRRLTTPEMLSYFSEQMSENASRGVTNDVSQVKLLQGDLSEAWREGDVEYATVAMRFELVDKTIDRATGRLVEGSERPQEVTELWTFMRARGGHWLLSAIQQT
jgi:predicted lipid-binding transport protein (Tim44 family)